MTDQVGSGLLASRVGSVVVAGVAVVMREVDANRKQKALLPGNQNTNNEIPKVEPRSAEACLQSGPKARERLGRSPRSAYTIALPKAGRGCPGARCEGAQ